MTSEQTQAKHHLLSEIEDFVTDYIGQHVTESYVYHDIQHTINVVLAARELAVVTQLDSREEEILEIAAWFHDTGYDEGPKDHEERSVKHAIQSLEARNYPQDRLAEVVNCIRATKMPHQPESLLEKLICDADVSHLGRRIYWDRCSRLRQEITLTQSNVMSDPEWIDFELGFMEAHSFHTEVGEQLFGQRKAKHIKQLKKQRKQFISRSIDLSLDKIDQKGKKKGKKGMGASKELKKLNLGRGVETMYRTTYRTHVNLSSIADNKANIMLSINAIIVSITVSTLVPRFDSNPKLILPTVILLIVCLTAVVFATLSTRPKITEGKFTREDIQNRRSNLLFFGNFYNMGIEDFHWGMMEMIKDSDFLYSSMTRDLYYLGVVLAKKYKYLSYCYNIFMYGLIISVAIFAISFMTA